MKVKYKMKDRINLWKIKIEIIQLLLKKVPN